MTPRRRAAVMAVGLLTLTLLAPACAGPTAPPSPPGGGVTPTLDPLDNSRTPGPPSLARPVEPSPVPPAPPAPPVPQAPPAPGFPQHLAGLDLERIPTDRRIVALTFDAGANADAVAPILATLANEQITATFFLTGDFVRRFPDESRAVVAAGHRLGNHSVSHPPFTPLTAAQIRTEVRTAEQEIGDYAGGDPRPFFRFPYGDRDARTIGAVNDLGYVTVRWTVDTLGWQGTSGGRSAGEVTQRVLDTARPGQIVLMHVGSHPTDRSTLDADALPGMIDGLRQRGYSFVTLDALLSGAG